MTYNFRNFSAPFMLFAICFFFVAATFPRQKSHTVSLAPKEASKARLISDRLFQPVKLDDKTKKYHELINCATRAIYQNDFKTAAAYYDSAFLYKSIPYYNDITNCLVVNLKAGFSNKNNTYIKMLFELKRVDTAYLFSQIPRDVFPEQNRLYINTLSRRYASKKNSVHPLDAPLREMFISDQKAHGFEGFNMSDPAQAKEGFAAREEVDHENLMHFYELYQKYGFPTEEKTGIQYNQERVWANVVYTLLLHFVAIQDRNDVNLAFSMIETEFKEGKIHPAVYAKLCDYLHSQRNEPAYNFMQTMLYSVNGVLYTPFVFYTDSLVNEVNTNRMAIGLDSFHVAQQQAVCQYIGAINHKNQKMVVMTHHLYIDDISYGFVKYAFDEAKLDMDTYRIKPDNIMKACNCREKLY